MQLIVNTDIFYGKSGLGSSTTLATTLWSTKMAFTLHRSISNILSALNTSQSIALKTYSYTKHFPYKP